MAERIDMGERHLPSEAVSGLVTAFLKARPEAFSRWIELERSGQGLDSIHGEVIEFLQSHCIYDDGADLRMAPGPKPPG